MRIVFMGTPHFAVPSLGALQAAHEVVHVYARPDAASGRGRTLLPCAVKVEALRLGVPVSTPVTLHDPGVLEDLAGLSPDLIVVAAYGALLSKRVLEIPRFGCINVHASLLPRWRGAAPIQRAILAGDTVTGVSIMRMEEGLDTGPYCATVEVPLADKGFEQVTAELAEHGARLLIESIGRIEAGTCEWIEQDDARATYAQKIAKGDVALSPELASEDFRRRVRASSSAAPARARIDGRGVTVLEVSVEPAEVVLPGGVAFDGRTLALGLSDGAVSVTTLKPDGKQAMDAAAWARGLRLEPGACWEAAQ